MRTDHGNIETYLALDLRKGFNLSKVLEYSISVFETILKNLKCSKNLKQLVY